MPYHNENEIKKIPYMMCNIYTTEMCSIDALTKDQTGTGKTIEKITDDHHKTTVEPKWDILILC